jgi:hypothetical protein
MIMYQYFNRQCYPAVAVKKSDWGQDCIGLFRFLKLDDYEEPITQQLCLKQGST